MGLSASICRRCVVEAEERATWHPAGATPDAVIAAFTNDWTRKGIVWCDVFGEARLPQQAKVNSAPPKWCPFAAEHAVSQCR